MENRGDQLNEVGRLVLARYFASQSREEVMRELFSWAKRCMASRIEASSSWRCAALVVGGFQP